MTMDERGKRWMAYMDGQMSASEALEFERSLSPEDQKRINDEVRLESAICESIAGHECCPVALWNSLNLRMTNQTPARRTYLRWQRRIVAAVAVIAVLSTSAVIYWEMFPRQEGESGASRIQIAESSMAEFARHTEVPGTPEAMQRYLDANNIGLKLVSAELAKLNPHHPVKILGACKGQCPQGTLLELRLSCCGKPIKLLIAKEGTDGANIIRRSMRCGAVETSRVTGGFITALVGDVHGHVNLLDLLQPVGGSFV